MKIGEVPMVCLKCSHRCPLDDANGDDPFEDGSFGCPIVDCGGIMKEDLSAMEIDAETGMYKFIQGEKPE